METADQEIAAATIKRLTAAQAQQCWSAVLRVWEVLNEEDRADLLGSFVQSVEVAEKEEVIRKLATGSVSSLFAYSKKFKLNSQMGLGNEVCSIYSPEPFAFETVRFRFKAKAGRVGQKFLGPNGNPDTLEAKAPTVAFSVSCLQKPVEQHPSKTDALSRSKEPRP